MIASSMMYQKYKKLLYINAILGVVILFLISYLIITPPNISPFNKLQGMKSASTEIKFLDDSLISDYIVFDDRMNIAKFLYHLPSKQDKMRYLSNGAHPGNHFEMLMPITIDQLQNKKVIIIHRYEESGKSLKDNILVKQLYEMPNSKNNFYISYFE